MIYSGGKGHTFGGKRPLVGAKWLLCRTISALWTNPPKNPCKGQSPSLFWQCQDFGCIWTPNPSLNYIQHHPHLLVHTLISIYSFSSNAIHSHKSIFIQFHILSSNVMLFHTFSSIFNKLRPFTCIFIHFHPFLSIWSIVFLSIFIHFYPFHPLSLVSAHVFYGNSNESI